MVVWLCAGGGEAEVAGLTPFLTRHFPCVFERKTPIRQKPGPRPTQQGYGKTGKSLAQQIEQQLHAALLRGEVCALILVIDDLDCRDADRQRQLFCTTLEGIDGIADVQKFVGFAAPELEAWLIADWDGTFGKHIDFRKNHVGMQWWLSHEKHIPFDAPETFSYYDATKGTCAEKLSQMIIEATQEYGDLHYSKASHTPALLQEARPEMIASKCPLFRELYSFLSDFCKG